MVEPDPDLPSEVTRPDGGAETVFASPGSRKPSAPDSLTGSCDGWIGRTVGRYQLVRLLGRGGMGVVFLAQDRELGRPVALKFILDGALAGPEHRDRLLREARAGAKLQHPGLVPVYEVALHGDHSYLAMAYVEGKSLAEVLDEVASGSRTPLPPREVLTLVRDAALAVHHAHEAGVVHRDLKPGNLMIDSAGRVRVLDLGLSRDLGDADRRRLTASQDLLGTPEYMSPEQASAGGARAADRRSDVFSLGVVLYHAWSGISPFRAESVLGTLAAVLTRDPAAPSSADRLRSGIPTDGIRAADVDTVCLKALEKDPGRRYATARELADELDRCLSGAPILARPAGAFERVARGVRRHRAIASSLAIALLALLVGGMLALRESRTRKDAVRAAEEQQARLAAERSKVAEKQRALLAQLRNVARLALEGTLKLRRQGVSGAKETFLPALEEACREAAAQAPDLAEPHFHLGRMRRALLQWDLAAAAIDQALVLDPRHADSLYERVVLLARSSELRIAELRAAWYRHQGSAAAAGGPLVAGAVSADRLLRPPAAAELAAEDSATRTQLARLSETLARLEHEIGAAAPAGEPPSQPVSAARLDCARGLVAAFASAGSDPAAAHAFLSRARAADPSLEEAYEGLVRLATSAGDLPARIEISTRGIEADQGYLPFRLGRAEALLDRANGRYQEGHDPRDDYRAAEADYDAAIRLDPECAAAWIGRGIVRWQVAAREVEVGEDPLPRFAASVADLDEGIRRAPDAVDAWLGRGQARFREGLYRSGHAEDPEPLLAAAESDLSRALALDPHAIYAWIDRGVTWMNRGNARLARGLDPGEAFERADADLGKALELDPSLEYAWSYRGDLRQCAGGAAAQAGQDWLEKYRLAEADYTKGIELGGALIESWVGRADLLKYWGWFESAAGQDPRDRYRRAGADYDRALAMNPNAVHACRGRAELRRWEGNYLTARGESGRASFEAALEDCGRALALDPSDATTLAWRGWTHAALERFGEAVADFEAAARLQPSAVEEHREAWENARRALAGGREGK